MIDTVKIRGIDYKINPFSDYHIGVLARLNKHPDVLQNQFDAAYILKEVILPDLPYEIIRQSRDDKYIFMIHAHEVNNIITAILTYYYQDAKKNAIANGDTELAEQFQANLDEQMKSFPSARLSDKDERIAELEKQIEEKQVKTIEVVSETELEKDRRISELEEKVALIDAPTVREAE